MDTAIGNLIDALGGTTAVARLTKSKSSTVHSWRTNGITESRLDHLRLAAAEQKAEVDFEQLSSAIIPIDRKADSRAAEQPPAEQAAA